MGPDSMSEGPDFSVPDVSGLIGTSAIEVPDRVRVGGGEGVPEVEVSLFGEGNSLQLHPVHPSTGSGGWTHLRRDPERSQVVGGPALSRGLVTSLPFSLPGHTGTYYLHSGPLHPFRTVRPVGRWGWRNRVE